MKIDYISNIKEEIKQSLINFISFLKEGDNEVLYHNSNAYKEYVDSLAEGVPKTPDSPWYNNGNILIEPSISYQDMKNKTNLYNHYNQYLYDLKKEFEIIKKKIDKYKAWYKEDKFDFNSKFLRIETSPLTFLPCHEYYAYVFDKRKTKEGYRIIGKSYPKEINFFEDITPDKFHVMPMSEYDFYEFLTHEVNFLKKSHTSTEINEEIKNLINEYNK